MANEIPTAEPWPLDWCVNCPHCDEVIEALDELRDFGADYTCPKCEKVFHIQRVSVMH